MSPVVAEPFPSVNVPSTTPASVMSCSVLLSTRIGRPVIGSSSTRPVGGSAVTTT
jgi:hypothetical protein